MILSRKNEAHHLGAKQNELTDYVFKNEVERRQFRQKTGDIIKGDIPLDRAFGGTLLQIYSVDRTNYTHGFHKFPAKYIPEIPRWAILKYSKKNGVLLDPFSGSGTTNVEARLHCRDSYAIDVDPIAVLLTKVKTTPLDIKKLQKTKNWLIKTIYQSNDVDIPDFPNRDYWFRPNVQNDLGIIIKKIRMIEDRDIRDFFLVCLSSIIKKVSNADPKFLYALAISKKMREQSDRKIDTRKTFVTRVKTLFPKIAAFSRICPKNYFVRIAGENATKIALPEESIDLAATSPPYLNAVDYPRAHKLQIYWFGLWKGKLTDLKKLYVGTEQVKREEYAQLRKFGITSLDDILEAVFDIDRKRSYVIYKYFADMKKNFLEVKRVLRARGHYCVAVADNVVRKIPVPTHTILMDIAREAGFEVVDSFGSLLMMRPHDMRKSEKMRAEWVTVFRKGD